MQSTAYAIVKRLQTQGFQAYLVGGCVRDMLLKKIPLDYDIVTSALPDEIENLFENTYAIGKQFGIINIVENSHHFEVATFRSDAGYSDGRRPDAVCFTNPQQDARRRDFTINGILYDPITHKYIDHVGGQQDLSRGLLRFIGDPDTRIKEDYLRILRAVRFKNRFQLEYDHDTRAALTKHGSLVLGVSGERIQAELNKILLDNHRYEAFRDLDDFGIGAKILPEVWDCKNIAQPADHHSEGSVFEHLLLVLKNIRPGSNLLALWAALIHDTGKRDTISYQADRIHYPEHQKISCDHVRSIAERLRFSRKLREAIIWIVDHHHKFDNWQDMKRSTQIRYFHHPQFCDLLEMHRADILGSEPLDSMERKNLITQITHIQQDYFDEIALKETEKKLTPLLDGNEIMKILNISPGKKIQELKELLLDAQLEQKVKNKDEAVKFIIKQKNQLN
jgi:tRNA nucleotidyltransferase (CCA-adding enzyme)